MSRRPSSATVRCTAAATCSASVTSAGTTSAVPPADSISALSSVQPIGPAREQRDRSALGGQRLCRRRADAAAGAGYQRRGARPASGHVPLHRVSPQDLVRT